jgi:hypothetical protein
MDPQIAPNSGQSGDNSHAAPRSLFADEIPQTPAPPPDSQPAPSPPKKPFNVVTRVVVPLVAFFVGVAAIAWIAQQIPRGAKTNPSGPENAGDARDVWLFPRGTESAWGTNDDRYILELEVGNGGYFDFPYENADDSELQVGMQHKSCVCTKAALCVFKDHQQQEYEQAVANPARTPALEASLAWSHWTKENEHTMTVTIPAKARGLVRLYWEGKKQEPGRFSVEVEMWSRPVGSGRDRAVKKLTVKVDYVPPLLFDVDKIDGGLLLPQKTLDGSFHCWSATRQFEVQAASDNKCFVVEVVPLRGKAFEKQAYRTLASSCAALVASPFSPGPLLAATEANAALADGLPGGFPNNKRVVCAFRVNVALYEQRDGKQLDMGWFREEVPLIVTSNGHPLPPDSVHLPVLRAIVDGDIKLPETVDTGRKIDFKLFKVKDGGRRRIQVWGPEGAKLTYEKCEPSVLNLDVVLKSREPTAMFSHWELNVTILPDMEPGPLPEDSVIVFNLELPAHGTTPAVTRKVRIPIVGSGSQQ